MASRRSGAEKLSVMLWGREIGQLCWNPVKENSYFFFSKEYLESEEYLWNSGMFVWRVSTILAAYREHMPEMYEGLKRICDADDYDSALMSIFPEFESISVDYGILEKAKSIYTIPGSFGWDDVGSWLAVGRIKKSNDQGNVLSGNVITIDSRDNIIQGGKKLIATVGLKDLIIVDSDDATLICDKSSAGDIKKVLENLKICNRDEYI